METQTHKIETSIGTLFYNLWDAQRGRIWSQFPLVVNRIPYEIAADWYVAMRRDFHTDEPTTAISLSGYQPIKRTDKYEYLSSDELSPSWKTRNKIEVAISKALLPIISQESAIREGHINALQSEIRSQEYNASYHRDKSNEHLKFAAEYDAKADEFRTQLSAILAAGEKYHDD